jgi:adenylylsulfate kinase
MFHIICHTFPESIFGPECGGDVMEKHIFRQHGHVLRAERESNLRQKGTVVWLTGLSGAGKTTLAHALERRLMNEGRAVYVLDGDNIRHGLCRDLGFSDKDRTENIRRIGEVSRLFMDAAVISLCSFISPFRADRDGVRALFDAGDFIEVYCQCPLEVCEERDVKGLYQKARRGEIPHFTGISSPYEAPLQPELTIDTRDAVDACCNQLLGYLCEYGRISG